MRIFSPGTKHLQSFKKIKLVALTKYHLLCLRMDRWKEKPILVVSMRQLYLIVIKTDPKKEKKRKRTFCCIIIDNQTQ